MLRDPTFGPDFLCVGMAKAGTGWLFDQLKHHPDFWMPPVKELGYLKREQTWLKKGARRRLRALRTGAEKLSSWANRRPEDVRDIAFLEAASASMGNPSDIAGYANLFRYKEAALSGDITPGYANLDPVVIRQLAIMLPALKLILLVRDPVDRAWSRLSMWARQENFDTQLLEDPKAFRDFLETAGKLTSESFPTQVVKRWKSNAPNLELRHFLFDDLVADPKGFKRDILVYLGADSSKDDEWEADRNRKAGAAKLHMTTSLRSIMAEFFRDELLACAALFDGAARSWPARYGI
ncbi:MAG: sulfotransferase [Alphaproteobacteria bacterium]